MDESKITSSHQWKLVVSKGNAVGAVMAIHAVFGRLSCVPSFANGRCVSPNPWSRIRMLVGGCPLGAAVMLRLREDGKSLADGRRFSGGMTT